MAPRGGCDGTRKPLGTPLNPSIRLCCDVRGVTGVPSIGPPWCREMLISRTAISLSVTFFPVWQSFYTGKTIFPFPFTLNGIWSLWQFSFRFSEPNGFPIGSKSKGKLSARSYPIEFESKWKYILTKKLRCSEGGAPNHPFMNVNHVQISWNVNKG